MSVERVTATIRDTPLNTGCTQTSAPSSVKPLTLVATKKTPITVPHTLYCPGLIIVAPRNTAVSAGKRNAVPTEGSPAPPRDVCNAPAAPARSPEMTKLIQIDFVVEIPTNRAALSFEPIASSLLPNGS